MSFAIPRTCPYRDATGDECGSQPVLARDEDGTWIKCKAKGHILAQVVPAGTSTIALPTATTRSAKAIVAEAVKAAIPADCPSFDRSAIRSVVLDRLRINAKYLAATFSNRAEDLVDDVIDTVITERVRKRTLRRTILAEMRSNPEFSAALAEEDPTVLAAIDKEGADRGMVAYGDELVTRDELAARAGIKAIARGWAGLKLGLSQNKRIHLGDATRPLLRAEATQQGQIETEARTKKVFYLKLAEAMPDDEKTVKEVFTDDDLQGAFAHSMPPALNEGTQTEAREPEA